MVAFPNRIRGIRLFRKRSSNMRLTRVTGEMAMTQFMSRLGLAHDRLTSATFVLAQFCLFVIVFAYSYETVSRYFFSAPTWWSNEIVPYALCAATFLALPKVTRDGGHIAITFVLESLSPRGLRVANTLIALLSAAVCLLVAWICLQANIQQFVREEMLVRVKPIPKIWVSVWLTYGFFSAGLHFLRLAIPRSATAQHA